MFIVLMSATYSLMAKIGKKITPSIAHPLCGAHNAVGLTQGGGSQLIRILIV
ncbi:hypothetical protein [Komagataeibacter sucrofermentans]|uniref:hypothetical protein n=1 Tax=Komagataeibacter sucrofermentans TaxID=1053551 RepID=UPI00142DB801|nr:hypothetical protein [Komagataeibacter sucrofermentans]